jgi:SpoVK/Ycf46/Vps4 family AAA+-type ATPase
MDFLDSNSASSNMIFIATTNNPELLPDKIINRPGRFDVILNIDFPSDADRRIFVRSKIPKIKKRDLDNIVKDTKDWTFAHMRELLVAFKIYEKGYDAVKARINKMRSGKGLSAKSYQAKLHDVGGSSDDQNRIGFDTTEDGADNVIGFKIKRKR